MKEQYQQVIIINTTTTTTLQPPPPPPPPPNLPYDRSILSSKASFPESAIHCLRLLPSRPFTSIFPSILEGRRGIFPSDFPTKTNEPRLYPIRPSCPPHRTVLYLITLSCDGHRLFQNRRVKECYPVLPLSISSNF